jgi:hypothetical protein
VKRRKRKAEAAKAVAAQSQATQRQVGTNQHSEGVDSKSGGVNTRADGNNATYAERRLRKDRPDLYALHRLLRSDRKPVGGWVRLGKYTKLKGTAYA